MKDKVRNICNLILGILFLSSTILGYYEYVQCMSEYCFISGIIVGIIFISSFIYYIKKKKFFPVYVYLSCMVAIIVIFIATILMGLNLKGAFIFIHIVNPLLLFVYWCFFCNHNKISNKLLIATDLIFPICYIIFAQVILMVTKECPFPANLILVGNSWYIVIVLIIAILLAFLVLGYIFHFINKYVYKMINSKAKLK